jgi:hypothetical protein
MIRDASRRAGYLGPVLVLLLAGSGACLGDENPAEIVALLPERYRAGVQQQLDAAGKNRAELLGAVRACPAEQRPGLAFLLANMPERDLTSLSRRFLLDQLAYAYRARAEAPWSKAVPEELFFEEVLPYAHVNERRDAWRRDFYDRFMPLARKCRSPGEAAMKLNQEVFRVLGVKYHPTKRPKPDQSPYESIDAGYASCTGLSVLLADACRAVGVPARFAGTPLWNDRSGNHTWVEVWDREWHFLGAAEPGPLDATWFAGKAAKADATKAEQRIYAASFRRGDLSFPLVWDRKIRYVAAVDVTKFYTARRKVRFRVVEKPDGQPIEARLTVRLGGRIVAHDLGALTEPFDLAGDERYEVQVESLDGKQVRKQAVATKGEREQVIALELR